MSRYGSPAVRLVGKALRRVLPARTASRWMDRLAVAGFYLFRIPTAPLRVLPDVVLIGTSKSGTSSLAAYLAQHADFHAPYYKEPHYFTLRARWPFFLYRAFFPAALSRWYARAKGRPFLTGDFTPSHYLCPHLPARLRRELPEARLLVLLRDPVERAFSHYRSHVAMGLEKRSFAEACQGEPACFDKERARMAADPHYYSRPLHDAGYVTRGLYVDYLRPWFESFPREQILVLGFEDLVRDPEGVVSQVCDFLGIERLRLPEWKVYNRSGATKIEMAAEVREHLRELYAGPNEELFALLGKRFPWQGPRLAPQRVRIPEA